MLLHICIFLTSYIKNGNRLCFYMSSSCFCMFFVCLCCFSSYETKSKKLEFFFCWNWPSCKQQNEIHTLFCLNNTRFVSFQRIDAHVRSKLKTKIQLKITFLRFIRFCSVISEFFVSHWIESFFAFLFIISKREHRIHISFDSNSSIHKSISTINLLFLLCMIYLMLSVFSHHFTSFNFIVI